MKRFTRTVRVMMMKFIKKTYTHTRCDVETIGAQMLDTLDSKHLSADTLMLPGLVSPPHLARHPHSGRRFYHPSAPPRPKSTERGSSESTRFT